MTVVVVAWVIFIKIGSRYSGLCNSPKTLKENNNSVLCNHNILYKAIKSSYILFKVGTKICLMLDWGHTACITAVQHYTGYYFLLVHIMYNAALSETRLV